MDPRIQALLDAADLPRTVRFGKESKSSRVESSLRERLFKGVDTSDPEGCWVVTRQPSRIYPGISVGNVTLYCHRISHYLATGEAPEVVMHTCDNPRCINPAHLRSGTQAENSADMVAKGRRVWAPLLETCAKGHPMRDPNLRYRKDGRRDCRQCGIDRSRAWRAARKATERSET